MTLNDVFHVDGLLKQYFPEYEIREGQVQMATLIQQAIQDNRSAVIEAATGTGKGLGYLIPILVSGESALVSTSNKNLQNQLDKKDLPELEKVFQKKLSWTVLKGKKNYFCHENFSINESEIRTAFMSEAKEQRKQGFDFDLADLQIQQIARWAEEEIIGDIEFIPFDVPVRVRELITCSDEVDHVKDSPEAANCFATQARLRAKESQIILVNHTLLALDVSVRRDSEDKAFLLPDTKLIVIDEAHEFEKQATLAFSDEISVFSLLHFLNKPIVKESVSKQEREIALDLLGLVLTNYLPQKASILYYRQEKTEKFDGLEAVIHILDTMIHKVSSHKSLQTDSKKSKQAEQAVKEAETLQKRMRDISEPNDDMLRWSEARDDKFGKPIVKLKTVPLDISPMIRTGLFEKKLIICTSATLSVGNSFSFFKEHIGMPDTGLELIIPSPFNYKKQALVYISDGSQDKYWEVQELIRMSRGRAFVLFTSFADMRDFYARVKTEHPKIMQGESNKTRAQVLEMFKNTPHAVLFATKSFWEGVDIKGDKLSLVIIHKTPFENPHDLVFSSKCERIDKRYGQRMSFMKLSIPDACIKLKQGVGRLIRSSTDKGVIALLDARITVKPYGSIIINALPPAYRTQQLEKVQKFFNQITS